MVDGVTTEACKVIGLVLVTIASVALLIACTVLALLETFDDPSVFSYWWIGFILSFGSSLACISILAVWYARLTSIVPEVPTVSAPEKSR